MSKFPPIAAVHTLGDYLREQRHAAELSLRQLSEVAGISNPYLSQIERGLKKPSAEILQSLAKALRISAESLYVRAGFLEERTDQVEDVVDVPAAVLADPRLSNRQRAVLLDVYESFVGGPAEPKASTPPPSSRSARAARSAKSSKTRPTTSTSTTSTTSTKPRPATKPAKRSSDPVMNTTKEIQP